MNTTQGQDHDPDAGNGAGDYGRAANQAELLARMWNDFAARMATSGLSFTPGAPPPEAARQMRGAVFQAMSQFADEFLRSEVFLASAKQTMDATITWRREMNDLLTRVHHELQGAAKADVDTLMKTVRHLESRVLERMEDLSGRLDQVSRRLDQLEAGRKQPAARAGRAKQRRARREE